ncbi:hypothetical protein J6590_067413 [Homalodisca vitripennis]|nr:hypothetical protein J6590_067413 [Homalodisca vitripennis]
MKESSCNPLGLLKKRTNHKTNQDYSVKQIESRKRFVAELRRKYLDDWGRRRGYSLNRDCVNGRALLVVQGDIRQPPIMSSE